MSFRNNHFQECDSSGVYFLLQDFPTSSYNYTALAYKPGGIISQEKAKEILNTSLLQKFAKKYIDQYGEEKIVDKLSNSNPIAMVRFGIITALSLAHLPYQIQSAFVLPLSSTYSFGPGLMYGLFTYSGMPYESFMSVLLFVNIIVFHLTVLLLVLICLKLKLQDLSAAVAGSLMLFSISMYSQGFNLGSVIWIISSGFMWLYLLLQYSNSENFLKKLSWFSGILVFFNYLIVLFWVGYLLVYFYKNTSFKSLNTARENVFKIIKSQIAGILLTFACAALFFQPGQGNRGTTSFHTFFKDLYYIILNFFSWYTHSNLLNILQFTLGFILIAGFIYYLFKNKVSEENTELKNFNFASIGFLITFFVFTVLQILGFAPTRHLLMLSPVIFIGSAIFINNIIPKSDNKALAISFVLLISVFGFSAIHLRHVDAFDRTKNISLNEDINTIGIYDCSYNLFYKDWNKDIKVEFINPKTFEIGKTYLYLSQTFSFKDALKNWEKDYNLEIETQYEKQEADEVYFLAHNPNFMAYLFTRPNNLFETKFKVLKVEKK